ncbi:MAG: replicative DNA helicase [Clostridia bacterium]|nr:replicative DNA helicase [Clostridia bacterium]
MDRDLSDNLIEGAPDVANGGRALPSDINSERAILSLCLRNAANLGVVINSLKAEDFCDTRNSIIFEVMAEMYLKGEALDIVAVSSELERKGKTNQTGGIQYLNEIYSAVTVSSNMKTYVQNVKSKSSSRKLITFVNGILNYAYDNKNSASDLIDSAVSGLSKMRETGSKGFTLLANQLGENLKELHQIATGEKKITTIKTGFKGLDHHLGGLKGGALYIIAARPGMGKTSLALNIATNVAINYHKTVCFFSLEMSKAELANKILITNSSVDAKKIQRSQTTPAEERLLQDAYVSLAKVPFYIDDDTQTNPFTMKSKLEQQRANGKVDLVVVDYLGLMTMPNQGKNSSRQQEVADIARNLKLLAMDMQIPVIALSQLSRGAEQREDHTPMLSDLRDSGAIEQDADSVIFIDRDDYYHNKNEKSSKNNNSGDNSESEGSTKSNVMLVDGHAALPAKIIVAKNRAGSTGTCKVLWIPDKTLFLDPPSNENSEMPAGYTSKVSSYTRTVDGDAAAGNYNFEEPAYMPPPEPEYIPNDNDVPPPYEDSIPPFEEDIHHADERVQAPSSADSGEVSNEENQEFFSDFHTDLPPDFI